MTIFHHHYHAFGLKIASPVALPLPVAEPAGASDVHIRFAAVAEALAQPSIQTPFLQIAPGKLWLCTPDGSRIGVRDGAEVTVDVAPAADMALLQLYLTTTCMAALLHQRGILVLHAAAMRVGQGAVLFAGASTSGKSSLAAWFHQRGFEVLADDLCAIDDAGRLLPGPPQLQLWGDVVRKLGLDASVLPRTRPQLERYILPLPAPRGEPLPVRAVYVLKSRNVDHHTLEPLTGVEKFRAIHQNTAHPVFVAGFDLEAAHLERCSTLVRRVEVVRLSRPDAAGYRFGKLFGLIASDLERLGLGAP